jgi:hypothetical protein
MLGWMLIFFLMALGGTMSAVNGGLGSAFALTSSVVFGVLLAVAVLTFILRGRV